MHLIQALLKHFGTTPAQQDVNAVLGKPTTFGETVVLPITATIIGFEFGAEGAADLPTVEESADKGSGQADSGYAHKRTIATIEVAPSGVSVHPAVDTQRVTLTAIALSLWILGWIGLMLRTLLNRNA
jgi:uncharacterized spore protein YtfJ